MIVGCQLEGVEARLVGLVGANQFVGAELLGVRGKLVSGSRGGGCVQFYTGQPITSGFDDFAVAQNREREAGHLLFLEMIRNVGINLICVKIDTSENQGDNDEGNRF